MNVEGEGGDIFLAGNLCVCGGGGGSFKHKLSMQFQ